MKTLNEIYENNCNTVSDINEHLPTLKYYASKCNHVTEFGVRKAISTYALMAGKPKKLVSYDIVDINQHGIDSNQLKNIASDNGVDFEFHIGDSRLIEIAETDFLFIDTAHLYDVLKLELELHGNKSSKYLGFHDTTLFAFSGGDELLAYPNDKGLWPAIEEFMQQNPHWIIDVKYENNNGLTILKRV